jgi:hypothetical protein
VVNSTSIVFVLNFLGYLFMEPDPMIRSRTTDIVALAALFTGQSALAVSRAK